MNAYFVTKIKSDLKVVEVNVENEGLQRKEKKIMKRKERRVFIFLLFREGLLTNKKFVKNCSLGLLFTTIIRPFPRAIDTI